MKKILTLLMVVVAFLSTLSFSTSKAQAAGIITYAGGQFVIGKGITFVFNASGYGKGDVRGASLFAGSNSHNLSCSVKKDEGKIICVARGGLAEEYGGEPARIYLAGQIFFITVPYVGEGSDEGCEDSDVLGAEVQFQDIDGSFFTEFVPGATLEQIKGDAVASVTANELTGYEIVSDLDCGSIEEEPSEEGSGEEVSSEEGPSEEVPGEEEPSEEAPGEEAPGEPIPGEEI